ncbi:MAG: protein translocase subunit SecF [Ignavibacteria bacterium]|jgi:preprotein translocase subunit SecF|nr:protein translocase subunit SecF [Ignavibacteria bacterium]MDH7528314.1 protein translocase subunit SecF [Ignavibacteria bacterium]
MRLFENINIDFLGKRKTFYIISISLIVLGLISVFVKGLEYGIDFKGGTEVIVSFNKPVQLADVRTAASQIGIGNVEVKTYGTTAENVLIRTPLQEISQEQFDRIVVNIKKAIEEVIPETLYSVKDKATNSIVFTFSSPDTAKFIVDQLLSKGFQAGLFSQEETNRDVIVRVGVSDLIREGLKNKFANYSFEVIKEDKVGPKIGKELRRDAVIAIFLSLIVILIYLGFRFKFVFGVGAVLALFHDVLVTLGFVSFFNGLIPGLNLEITQSIIAAFLTLVGFSVNDTVVVFDRIRENLKIHKTMDLKDLFNMSINRTLSRTILTSGTVFLVVLALLLFGGEVNRGFAFTFMVGIITGTYSSIYIASAIVYDWTMKRKKGKIEF